MKNGNLLRSTVIFAVVFVLIQSAIAAANKDKKKDDKKKEKPKDNFQEQIIEIHDFKEEKIESPFDLGIKGSSPMALVKLGKAGFLKIIEKNTYESDILLIESLVTHKISAELITEIVSSMMKKYEFFPGQKKDFDFKVILNPKKDVDDGIKLTEEEKHDKIKTLIPKLMEMIKLKKKKIDFSAKLGTIILLVSSSLTILFYIISLTIYHKNKYLTKIEPSTSQKSTN